MNKFSQRTRLLDMVGEDHIFPTVDAAVRYIEEAQRVVKTNLDE
jgi:hypothetical protein